MRHAPRRADGPRWTDRQDGDDPKEHQADRDEPDTHSRARLGFGRLHSAQNDEYQPVENRGHTDRQQHNTEELHGTPPVHLPSTALGMFLGVAMHVV